jgi:hypothetical protein
MNLETLKLIFKKIDKAEQESRFYALNSNSNESIIKWYTEVVGQMGIVHHLIDEVHDILREEIERQEKGVSVK